MHTKFVGTAFAILAAVLSAQDVESRPAGAESRPLTPKDKVTAVEREYESARTAFFKLYREAKTDEAKDKLYDEKYPKPATFFAQLYDIAKADPKGEGAEAAYLWIVSRGQGSKEADPALDALLRDHLTSKLLGDAADALAWSHAAKATEFLKAMEEKSPHIEVKGRAVYAQVEQKKNLASMAEFVKNASDEERRHLDKEFKADDLARFRAADAAALGKEAEAMLERVLREYADVEARWGGTLGERATGDLFEIRNLAIGKVAPNIEGEDIDGKPLNLADYRGKVVVLDFWGNW